jgi:hypothetical protein
VFITTTIETKGLHALMKLPTPPSIISLMGAIELSNDENL